MSAHHLPLLAREREDELSKCAYCPKLCRATCVVSEAETREAVTPWGKMTSAFDASRSASVDAEHAALAWACTGCMRCREACDHRNPVTETLTDARAAYVASGCEPPAIRSLIQRAPELRAEQRAAAEAIRDEPVSRRAHRSVSRDAERPASASAALLLGCLYATSLPEESRAALSLAQALAGEVEVLSGCCGHWQRAAGDAAGADATRGELLRELDGRRLLILDPRCALELRREGAVTLVELAARHIEAFEPLPTAAAYRYHDSCALGRGLGLYDEPRRLIERLTGVKPGELASSRELARCSGGGGLVPLTMPHVARYAAARLAAEHGRGGGGTLVTGCASSLWQLRSAGADAVDLIALLQRGLQRDR